MVWLIIFFSKFIVNHPSSAGQSFAGMNLTVVGDDSSYRVTSLKIVEAVFSILVSFFLNRSVWGKKKNKPSKTKNNPLWKFHGFYVIVSFRDPVHPHSFLCPCLLLLSGGLQQFMRICTDAPQCLSKRISTSHTFIQASPQVL